MTATAHSQSAARKLLKDRLLNRPGYGSGGLLSLSRSIGDVAVLWLADLTLWVLAEGTKQSYRDNLRLHVLPAFEHYTLGEITTGRVEWFLKSQAAISSSRAKQSRTMLNLVFGFALRHDAIARNPVEGMSPLRTPKGQPQALTLEQMPPPPSGPTRKHAARRTTARSATSSRCCSAPGCGGGRSSPCGSVTSPTGRQAWSLM